MTRDAFVSYATQDSRKALLLCSGLKALGVRLWVDTDDARRSRARWREAVQAGLASSRTMLVALSPCWVASPACRYELAVALERRLPLIGACVTENMPMPVSTLLLPDAFELIVCDDTNAGRIAAVAARLALQAGYR